MTDGRTKFLAKSDGARAVIGPCGAFKADGTTPTNGILWMVVTPQPGSEGFFRRYILLMLEGVTNLPGSWPLPRATENLPEVGR